MSKLSMIIWILSLMACTGQVDTPTMDDETTATMTEEEIRYTMPEESERHEATWLQWPHHYQYGMAYRNRLDPTWIAMTQTLVKGEKVHIIAYNLEEQIRITELLNNALVALDQIDFYIYETDDTWVRDNGPIYVRDQEGQLKIEDWGFNAWGNKIDAITGEAIQYSKCNKIPALIAEDQGRELVDLNQIMINEGGSIELDGNGSMMACKSSIINENRNPGMSQIQAEQIFTKYLGVSHFIWLDGQAGLEITDQHIDGFARFGNSNTIVTMDRTDLSNFDVKSSDIDILFAATDKEGKPYHYLKIPLSQNDVVTTDNINLGYKGSYINYYIANTHVLVPNYMDPNDEMANTMIQSLYPDRTVVGIDVRNLYQNGGMIHCVTQQQPID